MLGWLRRLWGGRQGSGSVPAALRRLLHEARSADAARREQAARALGEAEDERAASALLLLMQDAHTPVRDAARASLRRLGGVALRHLLAGLKHPSDEVAAAAADLLGELGRPEAVAPLLIALKFATRPVQLAARRALERLGPLAAEQLRAAADEPQPWVRQRIVELLERIARPEDRPPDQRG